jgi:hypothetical protein
VRVKTTSYLFILCQLTHSENIAQDGKGAATIITTNETVTEPRMTEPRKTEPRKTERRKSEPRMTEPRMTEPRIGPNLE